VAWARWRTPSGNEDSLLLRAIYNPTAIVERHEGIRRSLPPLGSPVYPPLHTLDMVAHSPNTIQWGGIRGPSSLKTKWDSLESLWMRGGIRFPMDYLIRILYEAPRLRVVDCSVRLDSIHDNDITKRPFIHDCLELLQISSMYCEDDSNEQVFILEDLFSYIALPSLKSLAITFDLDINFDNHYGEILVSFLFRSACSLKNFKQYGVKFADEGEEDQLIRVLAMTSSLEYLEIGMNSQDANESISETPLRQARGP